MLLLDCPPEIFQRITHELVSTAGFREAWKLRIVCRTFANEFAHDIFANHSAESLERCWSMRRVLDNNIDLLLFNRLKKPLGAAPALLEKIRDMAKFLAEELALTAEQKYQKLLMQLCRSIASSLGTFGVLNLLSVHPGYAAGLKSDIAYLKAPLDLTQMFIAAVAVDAYELVSSLLPHMSENSPWRIPIFGSPLEFAIDRGSEQMVRTILDCLVQPGARGLSIRKLLSDQAPGYKHPALMAYAIWKNECGILRVMKEFYEEHVGALDKKSFNTLLSRAIGSGMVQIVDLMLHCKVLRGAQVTMNHLIEAARSGSPEIMLTITSAPGMGINRTFKNTSPLIAAVRAGSLNVVRAVLNAGADVDMRVNAGRKQKSPVSMAIEARNEAITQVLLDHGAIIPPDSTWPRGHGKHDLKFVGVREMLQNEKRKRMT